MVRPRSRPGTPSTSWRWHIPPPFVHGSEALEAAGVLDELPGPLGTTLWQLVRDLRLWAATAPSFRGQLFSSAAPPVDLALAPTPALCHAIQVLASVVNTPTQPTSATLGAACREISQWAASRGHLRTALAFALNEALLSERDPEAAFWVGTLGFRAGEHSTADVWFRRTAGLARWRADWDAYGRAYHGLGNLSRVRGNLPAARLYHLRALRAARRAGLRLAVAGACHDLFADAVLAGGSDNPEQWARRAFEAYGTDRRMVAVAHDLAYWWMENGYFARALPVFRAVLPHIERPVERLVVLSNVARAAAGAGDAALYQVCADRVRGSIDDASVRASLAAALLEVARGAATLRDWEAAAALVERVQELARDRHEGRVMLAAEALAESIERERHVQGRARRPAAPAPAAPPTPADTPADDLAAEIRSRLDRLAPVG